MANVNISWNDPAGATDIDHICLHRFGSDKSGVFTTSGLSPEQTAIIAASSEAPIVNAADATYTYQTAGGAKTFLDLDVAPGTYTYCAFSKNAGGTGPGERHVFTVS